MKIYISTAREDQQKAVELATMLEKLGHEISDKWFLEKLPANDQGTPTATQQNIGYRQRYAILNSDLLVYLSPHLGVGRGCHIELGLALARSRPRVAVVGELSKSNFEQLGARFLHTQQFVDAVARGFFG